MRAKASTFTSDKTSLLDLLKSIKSGEIQLPDFQRGWVWDDDHIRDLVASVSLSYPIGTIMLLETGGEEHRFKPRQVEGAPEPLKSAEYLILDGQQRLTSLLQALYSGEVVHTKDVRKKPIDRWYYLDMDKALDENADRDEAIWSLAKDRKVKTFRGDVEQDYSTPGQEYAACLFPLNQVFDSATWRRGFSEFWDHDVEKAQLFDEFEREIIDRFKSYLVPIIIVKKQTPKEAVCQVFEKVNTGGVTLTVFELLTASFAADEYNLRDDWEARIAHLKRQPVLDGLESTDFLQAITLLVTFAKRQEALWDGKPEESAPGISCKRKDILQLNVDEYCAWAGDVEKGFLRAARFLHRQKIFAARDIPYRTQLVPLAAIMAHLNDDADRDGVQRKLEYWYWCGVLGELYGSAVESRFARDLPEVIKWIEDDEPAPKTVSDANFVSDRLYTLRTRNSAAYKGIHALLMRDGCLDFLSGDHIEAQMYFEDRIDIHHIFPYNWCNRHGIDAGPRDCIVNKTPLAARTNRKIGGRAPSEYLQAIERDAHIPPERMDEILGSHLIAPEALRQDDFEAFMTRRQEALLARIEQAMGKAVVRDQVAPEYLIDDDYEGAEATEEVLA